MEKINRVNPIFSLHPLWRTPVIHSDRMKINPIIIIAIFIFGIFLGYAFQPTYINFSNPSSFSVKRTFLAAVDNEGNGLVIPLIVEARVGSGRILTNIDKLLFWVDTQQSIQTARFIAEKISGVSTNNIDLIYTIQGANVTLVGGPSAGAALTLATIAALQNKTINTNVMITGTINEDGTIGPVGAILQKAEAAKEAGATIFLVPEGEGTETYLKPQEKCSQKGRMVYCETTYDETSVNVGQDIGINVIEVSTIQDAMKFFLS